MGTVYLFSTIPPTSLHPTPFPALAPTPPPSPQKRSKTKNMNKYRLKHRNKMAWAGRPTLCLDDEVPGRRDESSTSHFVDRKHSAVFMKGIPESVHEEYIEMFFENEVNFTGVKVRSVCINRDERTAIVTFKDKQAVNVVLEKECIIMKRAKVLIESYNTERKTLDVTQTVHNTELPRVVLKDLPDDVDQEDIEMVLSSTKRVGNIEVVNIDYNEEDSLAIVTLGNQKCALFVANRSPMKFHGSELLLRKLPIDEIMGSDEIIADNGIDKAQTQLLVEDIPEDVDKEILEMFFESRRFKSCEVIDVDFDEEDRNALVRFAKPEDILELYFDNENKSGGSGIVESKTTFDSKNNIAFVTFKEEKVAERVVLRQRHYLRKRRLHVTLFRPTRSTKCQKLTRYTQKKSTKTIRVRGMRKIRTREFVNLYFESKKRAGGGDIESRYTDEEDDDTVYITFNEENAAKAVADRAHHTVDGVVLTVSLYFPSVQTTPCYTNKILIKGLNAKITESLLGLFLEAKANYTLIDGSLTYHAVRNDVALVTTEQDIDFETLKRVCRDKPMEGSYLDVSSVPMSNCIVVFNIPDNVTKDMVELYFENNKRSNGGPVSKVGMFKPLGFSVGSVLSKEQTLSSIVVEVKRYLPCIARAEVDSVYRKLRFCDPIAMNVSPLKMRFIKSSQLATVSLDAQMSMCYAALAWSEETSSVEISCTLTTEVKNCIALACNWKEVAEQKFNDFMDKITEQDMPVIQELWEKVTPKLSDVSQENPKDAAVYLSKKYGKISIVGVKHVADQLINSIRDVIKLASDEFATEKQWTREHVTALQQIQTRMLLAEEFPTKMEEVFPGIKVEINLGKNEIIIKGNHEDVNTVLLKMHELKDKFCAQEFQVNDRVFCLYDISNKTVKEYILKKLKNICVVAVWEKTEKKLLVMSASKQTLATAARVVFESVLSKTILLSEANISLLLSHTWKEKREELKNKYKEKLVFDTTDFGKLVIGTTDDITNEVESAIQSFLRAHSIFKDKIRVPHDVYQLFIRHHVQDFQRIASSLQSENVRIFLKDDAHEFEISGSKVGMGQAKTQVEALLRKVNKKQHTCIKPGLRKYLQTEKGSEIMQSVESAFPCVISMNEDDDDMGSDKICVIASCTGYENRRMFAAVGDMSELNVEVIVNPSNDKIGLSGGLGNVIKMKGGLALERPCKGYMKNNGQLSEGEVFVSPAGNLKAKHIIHVVGPTWNDGIHQEDEKLTEVVFEAMKQASIKNIKSLAMPAISCGVYGFPVKKATGIIVAAVKNFFREEQDSSLTEIYLCDMKYGTVDAFTEALQKEWGAQNVKKHACQTQQRKPGNFH
ncbi:protein mono-ADP-ribosyltransferase PARP14-like [Mya arenaria]|uniref:protein mono-ADP-ribosyltransferase PARP14-like n=1 Tax=Mya arenaria TaxID=6604 RepID=UPI0022E10B23|nr:protein mono-ADP-ribosyltransferase PARP14-like [Mya arenaria]